MNRNTYNPLLTAIHILFLVKRNYGERFRWREDWEDQNQYFIDKLAGSDYLRNVVDSLDMNKTLTAEEIYANYNIADNFKNKIEEYTMY